MTFIGRGYWMFLRYHSLRKWPFKLQLPIAVAPGEGWGAIASHWNMLAPIGRWKTIISEIFGIYSMLLAVFEHPRQKSQPPSETFWRHPWLPRSNRIVQPSIKITTSFQQLIAAKCAISVQLLPRDGIAIYIQFNIARKFFIHRSKRN